MLNYQARNAAGNMLELYVYDVIGDEFNGITARQVLEDIKASGKVDTIHVRINSPGGLYFDGSSIYNLLREHPAKKIVDIDGIAASAASIIAMAGDVIRIAANGMMMIHRPMGSAHGNIDDMMQAVSFLERAQVGLVNTYVQRTKLDVNAVSEMVNKTTYFTAQEAIDNGFADEMVDEMALTACMNVPWLKSAPKSLMNRFMPPGAAPIQANAIPLAKAADLRRRAELRTKAA
jgi:ATP-dependent Clp protease, protease subunit